jgi:dTDP-4-amino-4,6-dideoxygalactose transaminase
LANGFRTALTGSGRWTDDVDSAIRHHFRVSQLLLTDSGTTALRLALHGAHHFHQGPVALPAFSCFDVATAVVGADVPAVFYDLDPATLGPDLDSLREALKEGASVVVVVHLYGIPVEMTAVRRLAAEFGVLIIEDAAQGFGAEYDGRPLGSIGSIGILSFGRGKGLSAGSGGCLVATGNRGAKLISALDTRALQRTRGWSSVMKAAAQWTFGRPTLYAIPYAIPWLRLGETHYRGPWEPMRISIAASAVLAKTVQLALKEVERRRCNADTLSAMLGSAPGVEIIRPPTNGRSSRLRLPVLVDAELRQCFMSGEAVRLGIAPGYPKPLTELPQLSDLGLRDGAYPGASLLCRALFTMPTHSLLRAKDLTALAGLLR